MAPAPAALRFAYWPHPKVAAESAVVEKKECGDIQLAKLTLGLYAFVNRSSGKDLFPKYQWANTDIWKFLPHMQACVKLILAWSCRKVVVINAIMLSKMYRLVNFHFGQSHQVAASQYPQARRIQPDIPGACGCKGKALPGAGFAISGLGHLGGPVNVVGRGVDGEVNRELLPDIPRIIPWVQIDLADGGDRIEVDYNPFGVIDGLVGPTAPAHGATPGETIIIRTRVTVHQCLFEPTPVFRRTRNGDHPVQGQVGPSRGGVRRGWS